MTIISFLATILGIITGLANVPQIIKIFKTKSAKDLSIITNIIFFLSSCIWLLYGIQLSSYPLIIANIIYIVTYALIIIGFFLHAH
ncbi:MAG: SemiSWEET family sugar transporter [Nanoarchaeota archaeon]